MTDWQAEAVCAAEGPEGCEVRDRSYWRRPGDFQLECGAILSDVMVAYETWGRLNRTRDNAVLVLHALTGDSHVSSHGPDDPVRGWWEGMVGPRMPIDTERYFVLCSNVLGGCSGTTGPASVDPKTGRRYGLGFPEITIRDMVRLQRDLAVHLGIRRFALVVGGSMGGMQALEWASLFPLLVERVCVIGAPSRSYASSIAFNEVGRQAIMLDARWASGDYEGRGPERGLAIARMIGMITYHSYFSMDMKFGRRRRGDAAGGRGSMFSPRFEVERYLHYQGEKLVRRFDANSYLYLSRAMDMHDLGGVEPYEQVLSRIKSKVLVIGISTDILYPPYQMRELCADLERCGVDCRYCELDSPYGHDAFLIEVDKVGRILKEFIK